ncbi:hypothetical protein [Rhodoglobus aureus]|uniref:Uncharacterized protein n=1 Tax=Rhodoglobus aureus TaxID=191497 RepID=A0ABN1VTZ7_9MICO
MTEVTPSKIPAWLRTWWGRLVAVFTTLTLVVGAGAATFQILDYLGWYSRPVTVEGTERLTNPGPVSEAPSVNTFNGGYGPERDTFTMEKPAPYAVLNSITNNPYVGDERNFFRVRLDEEGTTYGDSLNVVPGDVLWVSMYLANNAADNLAGPSATIHGLTVRLLLPDSASDIPLGAMVEAKNATAIWNGAMLHSQVPINVQFINGSALFQTNQGEFAVSDSFGSGEAMLVGQTQLDGEFPVGVDSEGRGQGTAYLIYKLVVAAAD